MPKCPGESGYFKKVYENRSILLMGKIKSDFKWDFFSLKCLFFPHLLEEEKTKLLTNANFLLSAMIWEYGFLINEV